MPVLADAPSMMATALAHEIKNPAALAMAYAGIVRQISSSEEIGEYCNLIQNALMDISDLVQELLFSVHHNPQPCMVDISATLAEMLEEYRMAMPCVIFKLDIPAELLYHASEQYLRLVLSNLIKNAAEATDGTSGYVKIYATDTYRCLQITIRNSTKIANVAEKKHSNGMGIGICHWLLQQLGGEMCFESNVGECVTTVSLPYGHESR